MVSYPRTPVWCCRFDWGFIFIVNLNQFYNVFKSKPANIVSWLRQTILMPNYWPSRSVLRWMSRNPTPWDRKMVLLSTFGLQLTCFCFGFLLCMYDWKTYCIVYLYIHTSQIDCFRNVHKILRWIGSSDFKQERALIVLHLLCHNISNC